MHRRQPAPELLGTLGAERALRNGLKRKRGRIRADPVHLGHPHVILLRDPAQAGGFHLIVLAAGAGPGLLEDPHLTAGEISSRSARHERSTISTTCSNPSSPP